MALQQTSRRIQRPGPEPFGTLTQQSTEADSDVRLAEAGAAAESRPTGLFTAAIDLEDNSCRCGEHRRATELGLTASQSFETPDNSRGSEPQGNETAWKPDVSDELDTEAAVNDAVDELITSTEIAINRSDVSDYTAEGGLDELSPSLIPLDATMTAKLLRRARLRCRSIPRPPCHRSTQANGHRLSNQTSRTNWIPRPRSTIINELITDTEIAINRSDVSDYAAEGGLDELSPVVDTAGCNDDSEIATESIDSGAGRYRGRRVTVRHRRTTWLSNQTSRTNWIPRPRSTMPSTS